MIILLRKKKKQEFSKKALSKKTKSHVNTHSITKEPRYSPFLLGEIAKKVEHEPALIRIGKNGLSETIIEEIKKLLSLKKAVKVKILQNSPIEDSKTFFMELEETIGYELWRVKGNTGIFIFKRKRA